MESLQDVALVIAGLLVLWVILRFFLRLTRRIFSCGCALIVLLGLFLAVLRLWQP
jgi:hypothetical protein